MAISPSLSQYQRVRTGVLDTAPTLSEYQHVSHPDVASIIRSPAAPIDFGFGGGASQGVTSAPAASSYGFPERISMSLAPVWDAASSLARAPQVTISNLKMLPGNPIGEALGGLGRNIENAPLLGGALGVAKNIVTSPFESAGYLFDSQRQAEKQAAGFLDIGQAEFWKDPWSHLMTNLSASRGELGAGLDLLSTAATLGAGGALLKGAKEGAGLALKDLGKGLFDPAFGDLLAKDMTPLKWLGGQGAHMAERGVVASKAEFAGRLFGRATIALSGIGVIEQNALQKLAPNSEWTQKVVNERLVPDDSFWSMPVDFALSGAQDIFGLAGMVSKSIRAAPATAKVAEWAFGTHPAFHLTTSLPGWESAIRSGVTKQESVTLFHNQAIDQAVESHMIDKANDLEKAFAVSQGREPVLITEPTLLQQSSQAGFDAAKRMYLDQIVKSEGLPGLYQRALDVIQGVRDDPVRPGWGIMKLSAQDRLIVLDEYSVWGPKIERNLPGRLATPATNAATQSKDAAAFLSGLPAWDQASRDYFAWKYPALESYLKDTKEATIKAVNRVSGGAKVTKLTPEEVAARTGTRATKGTLAKYAEAPTVKAGFTRLYRGERPFATDAVQSNKPSWLLENQGRWFTTDAKSARAYSRGQLFYVDVPTADMGKYASGAGSLGVKGEHILPSEIAAAKKAYVGPEGETAIQTAQRKAFSTPTKAAVPGRAAQPSPLAQFGTLKAERRVVAQQALKEGKTLPRLAEIDAELNKIRDTVTSKIHNELQGADAQLKTRVAELESGKLTGDALHAAQNEIKRLEGEVAILTERYFDASLLGTRYHLDFAPKTRFISTVTPVSTTPIGAGRTRMGKVFDALFGAVPNKQLGVESWKYLRDQAVKGSRWSEAEYSGKNGALEELYNTIQDTRHTAPGGFQLSRYQSIWHIEPSKFEAVMQRHLGDLPKGMSWKEVQYRAYPSPFKIFQQQVLGKEKFLIPYNTVTRAALHSFARSTYPMIRFYLSPRFILLNLAENSIYRYGLGAAQQGQEVPVRLQGYLQEIAKSRRIDMSMIGTGDQLNLTGLGKLTMAYRPSEVADGVLQALHDTPVMQDLLKQEGITSKPQLAEFLQKVMADREKLWYSTDVAGAREQLAAKKVGDLNARVATTPAEERDLWQLKKDAQTELDALVIQRRQQAFTKDWRPELDPLVQAQWAHEMAQADHARQILFGNPQRNAVERVLNSYLLYWPLSYQLKAGRTMFEFMLSKGFGYKTNTTIGQAYNHLRHWHDDKLKTDSEYAKFFKDNKQLIFLLQQLFPATPDEIGVTLSPVIRLPMQVARGYRSPAQALERATRTGVVGDFALFNDIVKEQSKPGGFIHDFFQGFKQDNGGG